MTFTEWWGTDSPYEDCKNVAKMAYNSRDAEVAKLVLQIKNLEASLDLVKHERNNLEETITKQDIEISEANHAHEFMSVTYRAATREIDQLRKQSSDMAIAIDTQMVAAHIGVFNPSDNPVNAIKELMDWSYGLGSYFANEEINQLREQVTLLRGIVENVVEINPPLPMGMIEAATEALTATATEPK